MPNGFQRAALEGILAKILYLLTRLAIPPMVLSQVGLQEYGLWSIAFVLVGYLGLSVSGIATVYVREIAQAFERDDPHHASGMLSTGVALALLIGGGFCLGLVLFMPWFLRVFAISPPLQSLATLLLLTTTLVFLADLTLGAWGYVLHGLNRVHEQQRIWVASFILEWLIMVSLLYFNWGITALLGGFVLRYVFSIACAWWRVHQIWPALQLKPSFVRKTYLQPFLHLGIKSQISDACAIILHSADRILTSVSFGSASAAIVDLGSKLPATAISISSGISAIVLPRAACMNPQQLAEFYPKVLRLSMLSLLWVMPVMVACAPALHIAWLGFRPESAMILQTLLWLTPAWQLHTLTGCASSALRGQAELRLEFIYHLMRIFSCAITYFCSSSLLQFITYFAIGNGLAALAYLFIASQRLSMSPTLVFRQTLLPLLLGYCLAYSFTWLWPWQLTSRSLALVELLQTSSLFTLCLSVVIWKFALTSAEKSWLIYQWTKLLKHEVHHA
jgi:Na+-driven multidrug efflux pump